METSSSMNSNDMPSLVSHSSKIGLWRGSREFGDSGIEAHEGCLAFSIFEIPSIPDLSSSRFADFSQLDKNKRIVEMSKRFNQFLNSLHSLGMYSAVSLRYYFEPNNEGGKIRLFLIGRSFGNTMTEAVTGVQQFRETVQRSFPTEYSLVDLQSLNETENPKEQDLVRRVFNLEGITSIAEILKPEQTLPAWHKTEYCGFSSYYTTKPFEPNEGNDMIDFCRALTASGLSSPIILDLCFVPAMPLTETEKDALSKWQDICEIWGRNHFEEFGGGLYSEPQRIEFASDPNANEVKQNYADLQKRYGNASRCFLYSFRALWWNHEPPAQITSALSSFALLPNSKPQTIVVYQNDSSFQRAVNATRSCFVTPAVCNGEIWSNDDSPETLRRLHRLIDLKEASSFFRFPIAGRDGCSGMKLDTGFETVSQNKDKQDNTLELGNFIDGQRVTNQIFQVSPKELTKHCLIVGTPGSGKTTLCFSLLKQLWEDFKIPFIVLEPAKTEYRRLKELPAFKEDLLVFTVGNENISPFRFNPFEVPEKINLSEHISTLKTCFAGAFNLFDPLPMIFDEAIREIYSDKGWYESDFGGENPDLQFPTLEDFQNKALEIAKGKSYSGEVAGNIRGAIETRLGSLTKGLKGRCFNTKFSVPFDILLSKPIVFELDALNDDEKALFMMFILTLVRATAKTKQRERKGNLSHLVLVEEAHNVIGRGDNRASSDKANPKEVAIRFFTNMLAEMRAWGEGIIIADQLPTAIASEAIKNTNLKVMHRVVSADDRQELGNSMVFDAGQFQQAAVLPAGYSFVFKEGESKSLLLKEPNVKADWENAGFLVEQSDEFEITKAMKEFRSSDSLRKIYLPYSNCFSICQTCTPRVREQSEKLLADKTEKAQKEKFFGSEKLSNIVQQMLLEDDEISSNFLRGGCAFVHFNRSFSK